MFKATHVVNGNDSDHFFTEGTKVIKKQYARVIDGVDNFIFEDEEGTVQIIADYGVDEIKEN